jgi:membrane associated rhomboid family serine protease
MPLGILFWVIWVVWVLFAFASGAGYVGPYIHLGGTLISAVLFAILGYKCFGRLVQ